MELSSSINGEIHDVQYNDWVIDIKKDSEPDRLRYSIHRVPKSIRKGNEDAYTPQIVSIGPLHFGKKELKDMEEQKWKFVKSFFKRTTYGKLEEVLAFIKSREQQIRNCYSETTRLENLEYVKMILTDAFFVIELVVRNFEEDKSDIWLAIPAEKYALTLDLLKLENQLPYFLLEGLYKLVISSPPFIDICFKFFRNHMFDRSVSHKKEFKHFTDLQRTTLVEKFPTQEFYHEDYPDYYIPCATKLHESGVKFKLASKERTLVIRFEEGELRIPQLNVHHETETVFRNIMALEQCSYPRDTLVCAYVSLLDFLIEDEKDAQLLVDEEIICNWMGDSKALAKLFNKLSIEIPLVGIHYAKIYKGLKAYYDNPYNQNKAKLKRIYFSDIWRGTATVAAAVLLILTFVQTVSSVRH